MSSVELSMPYCRTNLSHVKRFRATYLTRDGGDTPRVNKTARARVAATVEGFLRDAKSRRAWAMERRVDVKALERAANGTHNYGIDFLDDLARASGKEPWELLQPPAQMTFGVLSGDEARLVTLARRLGIADVALLCEALERKQEALLSALRTITQGGNLPTDKAKPRTQTIGRSAREEGVKRERSGGAKAGKGWR